MEGYKQAITEEMLKMSYIKNIIFLGQQCCAQDFYGTLKTISKDIRMETPVCEELQMGMSIGLALEGYFPISIFQRMDFLPRADDQLINHLNLLPTMTRNIFCPKIVIRTTLGSKYPLDSGPQHSKDLSKMYQSILDFPVIKALTIDEVHRAYEQARTIKTPIMIIEDTNLY